MLLYMYVAASTFEGRSRFLSRMKKGPYISGTQRVGHLRERDMSWGDCVNATLIATLAMALTLVSV